MKIVKCTTKGKKIIIGNATALVQCLFYIFKPGNNRERQTFPVTPH